MGKGQLSRSSQSRHPNQTSQINTVPVFPLVAQTSEMCHPSLYPDWRNGSPTVQLPLDSLGPWRFRLKAGRGSEHHFFREVSCDSCSPHWLLSSLLLLQHIHCFRVGAYLPFIYTDSFPFLSRPLMVGRGLQRNDSCSRHSVPWCPADGLIANGGFTSVPVLQGGLLCGSRRRSHSTCHVAYNGTFLHGGHSCPWRVLIQDKVLTS